MSPTSIFFSQKITVVITRMGNVIRFSFLKISISVNFMRLLLKMTSEIRQKVASLGLRIALSSVLPP